jgi:hypothetical protein
MTISTLVEEIDSRVNILSKKELIKIWNYVFPEEESISEKDISSPDKTKEVALMKEIASIISDEISGSSAKNLLKVYNKLTGEKLTIHDIDKDEEESLNE